MPHFINLEKSQIIQERDETVQRFEKQVAEINEESKKLKENLLDQMQNEKTGKTYLIILFFSIENLFTYVLIYTLMHFSRI